MENAPIKWLVAKPGVFYPPEHWTDKIASGRYKVCESDRSYGPFTECMCRDDGSVVVTQRYLKLRRVA